MNKTDFFIQNPKLKDGIFSGIVPPDKLDQILGTRQLLNESQGRQHDTQYNKIDISELRGSYVHGGYRIEGHWKLQHRELLLDNPILGRKHYTSWSEDTGTFYQRIPIIISNGITIIHPSEIEVTRQKQGYLRDLLGDYFVYGAGNFRDKFVQKLKNKVQHLNGQNIADKLIESGIHTVIASKIPLMNESKALELIKIASKNISGEFSPTGLRISFPIGLKISLTLE